MTNNIKRWTSSSWICILNFLYRLSSSKVGESTLELAEGPHFHGASRQPIDYRCDDGRFPVSASCVTTSNPDLLSSSEKGVNPEIRIWKSTYLNELDARKPLVLSISQRSEERGLYILVQKFTISNPGLKAVSPNASPGWTARFLGRWKGLTYLKHLYICNIVSRALPSLQ